MVLTSQEVHYTLTLGLVLWGTMQFASYAVFGHQRPFSAVVIPGLVLLFNMALTALDQLAYLMLYTAASLLLLIQMHAFDERMTWVRRRMATRASCHRSTCAVGPCSSSSPWAPRWCSPGGLRRPPWPGPGTG